MVRSDDSGVYVRGRPRGQRLGCAGCASHAGPLEGSELVLMRMEIGFEVNVKQVSV
jgi:hypothetical protein